MAHRIDRRRFLAGAAGAAAATVVTPTIGALAGRDDAVGLSSGDPLQAHGPPDGQAWVATRRNLTALHAMDGPVIDRFFGPTSFGLGGWGASVPSLAWASADAFTRDLLGGRIPERVRTVMYDPENWAHTPMHEQVDAAASMERFARLARRYGYVSMITPHPGLARVTGGGSLTGRPLEQAYLDTGLQGAAAAYGDIVEIQAQHLVHDIDRYASFVRSCADQARAANPSVLVLSGLSTKFTDDPEVLFRAWSSVRGAVDGHYLNVPDLYRPDIAIGFLRLIDGSFPA